ncbi:MAG: c-type cytochrome biogenesis protein CcmI [Polynucleobacter sp.]|jgi:cytochrome c-type biogenesis protein CcmH|nr:c-type cytochrome biogenesis protein CcmI [Polynucleobacter sp.]MBU6321976.1 c-type cytochrome biogenesis protein CcmI [Burkholderiales bacterium]NBO85276.1 c-type cytochrome biogenesis protein CcmI [Burkholderiaceae bacterium]NBO87032.1 c-type cytochrome biogenesis protein CcmI [Burkholderiaceae bacterium]NCA09982.1 c-type cytochrome biogenesis protein CcmI [Burkholderiaceae bacterium]
MTLFILIAVFMTVVAVLLIVIPFRKNKINPEKISLEQDENIAILRNQLRQFELDCQEGRISQEQLQESRLDIEKRLLQEERAIAADQLVLNGEQHQRNKKWSTIFIASTLPIGAIVLYLFVGSPLALYLPEANQGQPQLTQQDIEGMVERLAQRLEKDPNNAEGWQMLGRSYAALQRMPEALAAYKKALALNPNNAPLLVDYADLLAFENKSIKGEPIRLVQKALQIDPNNLKGLALAGTASFETGDYKKAEEYWSKAKGLVPADSEFARGMDENIAAARAESNQRKK